MRAATGGPQLATAASLLWLLRAGFHDGGAVRVGDGAYLAHQCEHAWYWTTSSAEKAPTPLSRCAGEIRFERIAAGSTCRRPALDPLRDDTLSLPRQLAALAFLPLRSRSRRGPRLAAHDPELDAARAMIGPGADFIVSQCNKKTWEEHNHGAPRILKLSAAAALAAPLARPAIAQTPTTVPGGTISTNPQNSPAALVAKFEQENPGIKIRPRRYRGAAETTTRPACSPPSWQATPDAHGAPVLGRALSRP